MNENQSSMGERMANIAITHTNARYGRTIPESKPSKWMAMALKGEITIEEAEKKEEEDLMKELGLTAEDL